MNFEFSFYFTRCHTKVKVHSLSYYLPIASRSVMVSKLHLQTCKSYFESHWVLYSFDLLLHPSKTLSKLLLFTHSWRENTLIHTFPKRISAMRIASRLIHNLNSCHRVHFPTTTIITPLASTLGLSLFLYIYIYIYIYHHGVPLAQISLSIFRHSFLSSIAFGRSSILHPLSVQIYCREVLAEHPTLACACERVHRSTSLMSSFLLLQQCLACLARLVWMVFELSVRCPYSCCFVGCCLQDLFNTAGSILVQLLSSFLYVRLVSVHAVHPYSSIDTTAAWKKCALFNLIGLISIRLIVYQWLSMPLLVAC